MIRPGLLLLASVLACASGSMANEAVSAARLLDEAIQRPGDYTQICDAPTPAPFSAPPIPAFGLSVPQCIFLSAEMKKRLLDRRDEIVQEMVARFDKLDWLHPPAAPPVPERGLFAPAARGRSSDEGDPSKPSGQNPRALEGIMLTIVEHLDAVELLPHLLRLEDELHKITQTALRNDHSPLPVIDLGGCAMWDTMAEDLKDVEDWDKAPAKLKRKKRLFECLVFDRELLGVMLELLHRKNYTPLKESTPGLVRAAGLRAKAAGDETLTAIRKESDIPDKERNWLLFDRELGIPFWRHEHVPVQYSDELRDEARTLVKCFLDGTRPHVVTGAELLDAAIAVPGGYNQMCGMPPPVPFDAPVPAYGLLAPRHFNLSGTAGQKLAAHRDKVMPELMVRLKAIDLSKPQPEAVKDSTAGWPSQSGTHPRAFSSLMLSVVRALHGLEALPELLRLEDQLHGILLAAAQDNKAPLPELNLDSPVFWSGATTFSIREPKGSKTKKTAPAQPTADEIAAGKRKQAEFTCRIFQRELLGLIAELLRKEEFPALLESSIEKEYIAGMRKVAKEGELKDIRSEDDITEEASRWIRWDEKLGIPVSRYRSRIDVPYSETLRDELRGLADDFLKKVPKEKWKGASAATVID